MDEVLDVPGIIPGQRRCPVDPALGSLAVDFALCHVEDCRGLSETSLSHDESQDQEFQAPPIPGASEGIRAAYTPLE